MSLCAKFRDISFHDFPQEIKSLAVATILIAYLSRRTRLNAKYRSCRPARLKPALTGKSKVTGQNDKSFRNLQKT